MEGGIAIRTGEAGVMTCKLQGIELPKKIDWGRQKSLALHAWLFFGLKGVLGAFSSLFSSSS